MELEMTRGTLADQLLEVLLEAGMQRIYGVVGDSLNPVVDAIQRTDGIEWIHVRDEEAGAFATAAEAQLTGRLAVCAGSCGPQVKVSLCPAARSCSTEGWGR
jgi:pyruvate dehydrogenase (quinone)